MEVGVGDGTEEQNVEEAGCIEEAAEKKRGGNRMKKRKIRKRRYQEVMNIAIFINHTVFSLFNDHSLFNAPLQ